VESRKYRISSWRRETVFLPITKAIEESPAQTLDRAEEIFRFIFDKYGHDTEFFREFRDQIFDCLGWATEEKFIDDEIKYFIWSHCSDCFSSPKQNEVDINQEESQSNDEKTNIVPSPTPDLENQTKTPIYSPSEITLSELWQKYRRRRSNPAITEIINRLPTQDLRKSDEIVDFILKHSHEYEVSISDIENHIFCCLGNAWDENLIGEDTYDLWDTAAIMLTQEEADRRIEIRSASEITISEFWQEYFVCNSSQPLRSSKQYDYQILITKAINQSPIQTLDRGEEIFSFILSNQKHDPEFASIFKQEMLACAFWGFNKKIINQNTFCEFQQKSEDESSINQETNKPIITFRYIWEEYISSSIKTNLSRREVNVFSRIRNAINSCPIQDLEKADEFFQFVIQEIRDEADVIAQFKNRILICILWAVNEGHLDDETANAIEQSHINVFKSIGNDSSYLKKIPVTKTIESKTYSFEFRSSEITLSWIWQKYVESFETKVWNRQIVSRLFPVLTAIINDLSVQNIDEMDEIFSLIDQKYNDDHGLIFNLDFFIKSSVKWAEKQKIIVWEYGTTLNRAFELLIEYYKYKKKNKITFDALWLRYTHHEYERKGGLTNVRNEKLELLDELISQLPTQDLSRSNEIFEFVREKCENDPTKISVFEFHIEQCCSWGMDQKFITEDFFLSILKSNHIHIDDSSEIFLSSLLKKYMNTSSSGFVYNVRENGSLHSRSLIDELPVQDLNKSDEIFQFLIDKYADDRSDRRVRSLISDFKWYIPHLLSWAEKRNFISQYLFFSVLESHKRFSTKLELYEELHKSFSSSTALSFWWFKYTKNKKNTKIFQNCHEELEIVTKMICDYELPKHDIQHIDQIFKFVSEKYVNDPESISLFEFHVESCFHASRKKNENVWFFVLLNSILVFGDQISHFVRWNQRKQITDWIKDFDNQYCDKYIEKSEDPEDRLLRTIIFDDTLPSLWHRYVLKLERTKWNHRHIKLLIDRITNMIDDLSVHDLNKADEIFVGINRQTMWLTTKDELRRTFGLFIEQCRKWAESRNMISQDLSNFIFESSRILGDYSYKISNSSEKEVETHENKDTEQTP